MQLKMLVSSGNFRSCPWTGLLLHHEQQGHAGVEIERAPWLCFMHFTAFPFLKGIGRLLAVRFVVDFSGWCGRDVGNGLCIGRGWCFGNGNRNGERKMKPEVSFLSPEKGREWFQGFSSLIRSFRRSKSESTHSRVSLRAMTVAARERLGFSQTDMISTKMEKLTYGSGQTRLG
jgi:hypothetical protein